MFGLQTLRAQLYLRASPYRTELAAIPAGLYAFWAQYARRTTPSLPNDRYRFIRAAEGLCSFFRAVSDSGQPCALPSAAADSVWHAWLDWNPISLGTFGSTHVGRDVSHLPSGSLGSEALARTLVRCRQAEGIRAHGPRLPSLFRLDRALRMPSGHGYYLTGNGIIHVPLNTRGRPARRPQVHPKLTPAALLEAGLISQDGYTSLLRSFRKMQGADDAGGADTDFADDSSETADTADASDDSGSSCGGDSCGGGGD